MEQTDNIYDNDYYGYSRNGKCCLSEEIIYFKSFRNVIRATAVCPVPAKEMAQTDDPVVMVKYVWHILCTLLPFIPWLGLSRVIVQRYGIGADSLMRFAIEFIIMVVPTIISINVINGSVQYILAMMALVISCVVWRTGCLKKAVERRFIIGRRPRVLTLARSSINFITAFCILAIDFETFPKHFRKTRTYGVGIMDTGIGLFVYTMGTVSKRPRTIKDFKKMLRTVVPLLVLGILRTVVIMAIDYHQDEHEYGMHLNAFFTLGLTKFFGYLVSCLCTRDSHLLPLGIVTLVIHEIFLQWAGADFVMNRHIDRDNFLSANREGLVSLPGFVGIYLVSMYLGQLLQTAETPLTFPEFISKFKHMALLCISIWSFTILCIFTVSIARVTCNLGYAAMTLGIATIMNVLFMFIFELVLNTLYPIEEKPTNVQLEGGEGASLLALNSQRSSKFAVPSLIEAINRNGLVFFLIANFLTGAVNIFLSPEKRTNFEGYLILFIYMLISIGFVYALYRRNIRIA